MLQEEKRRTLIARWKPEQNCSVDLPHTVYWSDGSPATAEDYLTHLLDTHIFSSATDGIKLHMFPNVVADVHHDRTSRAWVVSGVGVKSAVLNISDPSATDDSILAELYTWPVVYQNQVDLAWVHGGPGMVGGGREFLRVFVVGPLLSLVALQDPQVRRMLEQSRRLQRRNMASGKRSAAGSAGQKKKGSFAPAFGTQCIASMVCRLEWHPLVAGRPA